MCNHIFDWKNTPWWDAGIGTSPHTLEGKMQLIDSSLATYIFPLRAFNQTLAFTFCGCIQELGYSAMAKEVLPEAASDANYYRCMTLTKSPPAPPVFCVSRYLSCLFLYILPINYSSASVSSYESLLHAVKNLE